jgi:hypothetical protein
MSILALPFRTMYATIEACPFSAAFINAVNPNYPGENAVKNPWIKLS